MSRPNILHLLISPVFILGVAVPASAQEIEVSVFEPPTADKIRPPQYPQQMLNTNAEGWVEVNFMVGPDGKAFEATVINSSGNDAFHASTLRAINNSTFNPATSNGEPIVGSLRYKMRFTLEGATGARSTFRKLFRDFTTNLGAASLDEASAALESLTNVGGLNHYENAYLDFARFMFAQKFETPIKQQRYLTSALSYSNDPKETVYLANDQALYARRELLRLQVTNKYYSEALATLEYLKNSGDTETVELFAPVKEAITRLKQDESSYGIPMTLDDYGHAGIGLFKHRVYVENINGKLYEFKLRCEKNYVGIVVEPEISYDIPAALGECHLEIIGDAGTTFVLVQH